jgi:hypothetical protein
MLAKGSEFCSHSSHTPVGAMVFSHLKMGVQLNLKTQCTYEVQVRWCILQNK